MKDEILFQIKKSTAEIVGAIWFVGFLIIILDHWQTIKHLLQVAAGLSGGF